MSSRIDLPISPSRPVGILCALPWLLLTALVALLASDHGLALLLLITLTSAGAINQYRRNGLLSGPNAVVGLKVENQQLYARLGEGEDVAVLPYGESRVSAGFTILKLRRTGTISGTYPVVLVALTPRLCNTSPEAFRQLRVWLRLGQQPLNVQETH
ncbi:hypothetical protein FDP08_17295 [Marinobacter panjinensis]|uniref:Toxin CptA n=1 Tax=Marinobacter panjinensis TaxID=2576384 RepID=A0A4U6QTM2_9GAMM|nr:hypothetical protein [Marinobacter panjinensis]MCR8914930.1 hypothetical protein [Marinobacter panjinensis]TKV64173.1 hypothetical protein FDP08_17295 [Marinobacter panjinensis]